MDVAFNVDFDELVQDTLVLNVARGQYQATTWRQFGGIDPIDTRHNLMCRTVTEGIALNFARFCSEPRDALIVEAHATTELEGTALRCVSNGRTWFDSTWIVE
ncbi:MAG: hypothetical protein VW906_09980 [Actinomycetota bacterium]